MPIPAPARVKALLRLYEGSVQAFKLSRALIEPGGTGNVFYTYIHTCMPIPAHARVKALLRLY